jgi:hypothetical protein
VGQQSPRTSEEKDDGVSWIPLFFLRSLTICFTGSHVAKRYGRMHSGPGSGCLTTFDEQIGDFLEIAHELGTLFVPFCAVRRP